jgi:hypothetical protein
VLAAGISHEFQTGQAEGRCALPVATSMHQPSFQAAEHAFGCRARPSPAVAHSSVRWLNYLGDRAEDFSHPRWVPIQGHVINVHA